MKALRYLNKYLFKYKFLLLAGVFFIICSNIFAILIAPIVRTAIDTIAEDIQMYSILNMDRALLTAHISKLALFFGSLVLASALIKGVFMYFMRQTIIVMSRNIEYDLKNEIFNHYQELGAAFYSKNYTGDLMNRISEDVSRVRMYLGPAIMYTINLFFLFTLVISVMVSINPHITLYVLLPLPLLSISIYFVSEVINKRSDILQAKLSDITTFAQETFSGIRVLKSFAVEKWFRNAFEEQSEEYRKRYLSLVKVNALFFPLTLMLVGLSVVITIYVGGMEVMNGTFSFGNIAEYVIYVNMLTWPVASLGWVTSIVQRAEASQNRINEFLNTEPERNHEGLLDVAFQDTIHFENVSFRYDQEHNDVLEDLTFNLKKGSSLGIIGTTGSGKSTIARLFLRTYSPTKGKITIDGQDIEQLNVKVYRDLYGYVPQDIFLFSDTIRHNIEFGVKGGLTDQEAVEQVAGQAEVHDDILQFPKKYDTMLGERGISLSGGQKQRVAIARALAREPEILLLDDCMSAVDTSTEARIKANLREIMAKRTTILISHRVRTVEDCDEIIVLDQGRIVESGTLESLLQNEEGWFRRMYEMQKSEEEVTSQP